MRGLVTSDWHLRADKPRCRLDEDWELTQRTTIENIVALANFHKTDIYIIGDLFDTPKVPERIVVMVLEAFEKLDGQVYFLAGNHDLPYHSTENIKNSSIGVLCAMADGHATIQHGMDDIGRWNDFGVEELRGTKKTDVLFKHVLVFKNKKDIPPHCEAITAEQLLIENKNAKYIFTGDMHKSFIYESKDKRFVINPGCIIRQSVNESDYTPCVYYVDTENTVIQELELNDSEVMVDDSYIKAEEERETRITAFVENIKKKIGGYGLDIEKNIEVSIEVNKKKLSKKVISMIELLVEEAKN